MRKKEKYVLVRVTQLFVYLLSVLFCFSIEGYAYPFQEFPVHYRTELVYGDSFNRAAFYCHFVFSKKRIKTASLYNEPGYKKILLCQIQKTGSKYLNPESLYWRDVGCLL